jgi:hypothetical protein
MKIFLILFLVALVALAWHRHNESALRRAEPDPSPPTPDPMDGKPMLNRTMEHNKEHSFLKLLIAHDASEESRQLQDDLAQAERDERCIRRAMFLMAVIFMLSLAGLGYCAILLPDVFHNPRHLVMRSLGYLGLGSLISQGAFLGYLLWHRIGVRRLRRECRRLVLALARSQLRLPAAPSLTIYGDTHSPSGFPGLSPQPVGMTPHESLSQQALRSHS